MGTEFPDEARPLKSRLTRRLPPSRIRASSPWDIAKHERELINKRALGLVTILGRPPATTNFCDPSLQQRRARYKPLNEVGHVGNVCVRARPRSSSREEGGGGGGREAKCHYHKAIRDSFTSRESPSTLLTHRTSSSLGPGLLSAMLYLSSLAHIRSSAHSPDAQMYTITEFVEVASHQQAEIGTARNLYPTEYISRPVPGDLFLAHQPTDINTTLIYSLLLPSPNPNPFLGP